MSEYFATKYDSAAMEVVASLASVSEGYGKAETGDVESPTGFVQLVHLDSSCDLDVQDMTGAYPAGDEVGEIAPTYNVEADDIRGSWLVKSDDRGFVYCEAFDTPELAQEAFDCTEARYVAWSDEDRDEFDTTYICPVVGHGYHEV